MFRWNGAATVSLFVPAKADETLRSYDGFFTEQLVK
jgi:hypothetical protein